jgi:hypothetical protein
MIEDFDLFGLTIHIAPEFGFENNLLKVRPVLWEGDLINEQLEANLLQDAYTLVLETLSPFVRRLNNFELRIEIIGKLDQASFEDWLAIGVGATCDERLHALVNRLLIRDKVAQKLCTQMKHVVMTRFAKSGTWNHLNVEVEVTNYGEMWH